MNWAEVRVSTTPEGIEILTGFLMAHGVNGVMIEDAGDFNRFLTPPSTGTMWTKS